MTNNSIAKFIVLTGSILGLSTPSWAGEDTATPKDKNPVEQTKESCITGDIGFNIVSEYVSRGYVFENKGFIIQPYADLYFQLYKGDGFLNKVVLGASIWDSFQSRHTQAGSVNGSHASSVPFWYENDFDFGIAFTFLKNWTITPSYYSFLSPNDAFPTFQGLNIATTYDDTDLLGKFALHPHFTYLRELENKAGGSSSKEGNYFEVGVAPAAPAVGPVTFSLPVTAGFGSSDFYNKNAGFGYFSVGLNAAVALKFVPACLGTWTANAAVTYYYLGHGLYDYNSPDVRGAEHSEPVYSGGVGMTF
jgi:hypothetical protein